MTGRIRYYITGRGVRQTGQIRHDRENQVLHNRERGKTDWPDKT